MNQALPITMTAHFLERRRDDDGWEHDAWLCSIYYEEDAREQRTMPVLFKMGVGHHGLEPTLERVLESLLQDADSVEHTRNFEEWCGDFGYDTDSRKAERNYRDTVAQTRDLKALLGKHYEELLHAER